jgi:hypothetical protein
MLMRKLLCALGGAMLVSGCATVGLGGGQPGRELHGQTLRVQAANGATSTMTFRDDSTVQAQFGRNLVTGRWFVREQRLCFNWSGAPQECWPYQGAFPRNRTVTLTSDRGNYVRVTRL